MASLPPVSPGSVLTESAGNGSAAYDIEADLASQMDRGEFPQEGSASAAPEENGVYPLGEEYGDEGDDEDEDLKHDEEDENDENEDGTQRDDDNDDE